MSQPYQQTSDTGWEWEIDGRFYGVRAFSRTQKIVWSAWRETGEGPKYQPGTSQSFVEFLHDGPPADYAPPQPLLDALHKSIAPNRGKRRWRLCG